MGCMRRGSALVGLLIAATLGGCGAKIGNDPAISGGDVDAGRDRTDAAAVTDTARPVDATIDARPCTGGALDGAGHCFLYHPEARAWVDAEAVCVAASSHLAIITNATQNALVLSLIGTIDPAFLGATDVVTEGTFLWTDGTALSFTNFAAGEPNNGAGTHEEDCLVMRVDSTLAGEWDDRPCATEATTTTPGLYPFVCEF